MDQLFQGFDVPVDSYLRDEHDVTEWDQLIEPDFFPAYDDVVESNDQSTVVKMEEAATMSSGHHMHAVGVGVGSSCSEEQQEHSASKLSDQTSKGKKKQKLGEKSGRGERFAFMTKSEVDHLEDGYRWRKYGQKSVKNSPFPRSYYKCTNSKCAVKKRVERSADDPSIVITTYEGRHCHHTPVTPRSSQYLNNENVFTIEEGAPATRALTDQKLQALIHQGLYYAQQPYIGKEFRLEEGSSGNKPGHMENIVFTGLPPA